VSICKKDIIFFVKIRIIETSFPKINFLVDALPCKNDTQTTRTFVPSVNDHQNEQLTHNIIHNLFSDHDVQNTKEDKENIRHHLLC
jgi:hypothetical protein